MSIYNIVISTDENTVVAEYESENNARSESYQTEAQLENEFIRLLTIQGYEHVKIHNEKALVANLRTQLEKLNAFTFSDNEWKRFFQENLTNENEGIIEKTRKIQDDYIQNLTRDDGKTKNVYLIDKNHIHNNRLQVINQYEENAECKMQNVDKTMSANSAFSINNSALHSSRYDVTLLVNGLPLVHVELKRRGVAIREAFNQIKRYQRDSFWAASGLYEYVQIFIISNGSHTKYYSNTTRNQHLKEQPNSERQNQKKTSNSFEFTNFWADGNNKIIADLVDFTKTFLAKHTILSVLTRYCIFTSEDLLLVMRPYQIAATERILGRIAISSNYKQMGSLNAGGFIWHTTGSGKTLTSFKTAQLASKLDYISKVLFVVDRKDLDYQTMKEYDRFEKGAANGNTSTIILQKQLEDPNVHIIITTIQKLDVFISKNKTHAIYKNHIVLIFDECHRSQFGDMHTKIVKYFKDYHIFGFTGTPIFAVNAGNGGNPLLRTTKQAFGEKLHTYTIVDAINDDNVLPFRVDFINTIKQKDNIKDKNVSAIDIEKALSAPARIREVVSYILEHFDQKTKRNNFYTVKGKRLAGFNSIFAVSSISMAMKYYTEFKKQMEIKNHELIIATIFSFCANEDDPEDAPLPDEDFNTEKLDKNSRGFLDKAIVDYNKTFSVNYDTSSERFQNYYKDISQRVKNREIDLLIVVNMFLTGFDATTLNTLWVDKNLRQHGLIQGFSRTNRILNSVKTFGNIVCFRDLKKATDDAIALFGDKDAGGIVLLKTYNDYYNGYDLPAGEAGEDGEHKPGYKDLIAQLKKQFPLGQPIIGEEAQKEFIRLYGAILRLKNILCAFDEFSGAEILSERDFQDYQSVYIDLYQDFIRGKKAEKENINDDIIFEIELIKQIEVNIDYILMLVAKYHETNCTDKNILVAINKAVDSSLKLRSKKELIAKFLEKVNVVAHVDDDWHNFIQEQKEEDLSALISNERLKEQETRRFIDNSFRDGALKTTGMDIDKIMPPTSHFSEFGNRASKKQNIIEKLNLFFEKYLGLV